MKTPRTKKPRRGTILVEAALIFLILFYLTFGMIEYGWMILKQQQITNTARAAARIAVRADSVNGDVTSKITNMMTSYQMNGSGYSTTMPANVATVVKGAQLSVTIQVPYNNIKLGMLTLLPTPTNLTSTVSMEKEGP